MWFKWKNVSSGDTNWFSIMASQSILFIQQMEQSSTRTFPSPPMPWFLGQTITLCQTRPLDTDTVWVERGLMSVWTHSVWGVGGGWFIIFLHSSLVFKLKLPPDGVSDSDLWICNKNSLITCAAARSSCAKKRFLTLCSSQVPKGRVVFLLCF